MLIAIEKNKLHTSQIFVYKIFFTKSKYLTDLNMLPLHKPRGFRVGYVHENAVEIRWERPQDLLRNYTVSYRALKTGVSEKSQIITVDMGKLFRRKM